MKTFHFAFRISSGRQLLVLCAAVLLLARGAQGAITTSPGSGGGTGTTPAQVAAQITTNDAAASLNQVNLIKNFGATNDGFFFNRFTIASGSANLAAFDFSPQATLHTNFNTGDSIVGKVIMLWQCGAAQNAEGSNNCFTTTVLSVTDGTNIVLAAAVSLGHTNQTIGGVIGSDNTAFIQAAYNTISNGSFECIVPSGVYVINGANPLDATQAHTNRAQIVVPPINTGLNTVPIARMKGPFAGLIPQAILGQNRELSSQGATFVSTCTNLQGGSMIDAANYANPGFNNSTLVYLGFNYVSVEFDGINVIGAWNNNGALINCAGVSTADFAHGRISSGYMLYNCPKPSLTNTFGLVVPIPSSGGPSFVGPKVEINGFYSGVNYGEHIYGIAQVEDCVIAMQTDRVPTGHGNTAAGGGHQGYWYLDFEACKTNISDGLNVCKIIINCTSESPDVNHWSYPSTLIDTTASSAVNGIINYEDTSGGLLIYDDGDVQINNTGKGSVSGSVTNGYLNTPTLNAAVANLGSTGAGNYPVKITSASGGNNMQMNNAVNNSIRFLNSTAAAWDIGVDGGASGFCAVGDLYLSVFGDTIGGSRSFAFHQDASFQAKANMISPGATTLATNRISFTTVSAFTNTLGRDAFAIFSAGTSVILQDTNGANIATLGTVATLDLIVPMRVNMRATGTGLTAILY